jgi:fucose permease
MGFLGCAFLPVLQGKLADSIGLQNSFLICVIPYLFALFYALKGCKMGARQTSPEDDDKQSIVNLETLR